MYDSHPERGLKRTCLSCEAKFYDMVRTPMVCPKCGAEFTEVIRPVSPSYQGRRRGFFAKNRPEEALEPGAEEARPETEDGEEAGEEGERELDGEGDEPQAEEAAED